MPGGIDESPAKGESIPSKTKHSFQYVEAGPPEPMTYSAIGRKYAGDVKNTGERVTRSQKGSEEKVKEPWRAPGPLQRTASSEIKRKSPQSSLAKASSVDGLDQPTRGGDRPKDLDQSGGDPDGDRSTEPDRPGQPGSDRSDTGKGGALPAEEENIPPDKIKTEMSTPLNITDVSEGEVENDLLDNETSPERSDNSKKKRKPLPDQEGWVDTIVSSSQRSIPEKKEVSGSEYTPRVYEFTIPGINLDEPLPVQTSDEVTSPFVTMASIEEKTSDKSIKKMSLSSIEQDPKGTTEAKDPPRRIRDESFFPLSTDRADRKKGKHKFVRKGEPPFWREYLDPPGIFGQRKWAGTGAWSEVDLDELTRKALKWDDGFLIDSRNVNRDDTIEQLRNMKLDIQMPPIPTGFELDRRKVRIPQKKKEVIRVNSMIAEDVDSDFAKFEEFLRWKRSQQNDHDQAMERISTWGASLQPRNTYQHRPMDEVRIDYRRNPMMPNGLTGSTSARVLEERSRMEAAREYARREKRAGSSKRAPSISTRNRRTVVIDQSSKKSKGKGRDDAPDDPDPEREEDNDRDNDDDDDPHGDSDGGGSGGGGGGGGGPSGGNGGRRRPQRQAADDDSDDDYDRGIRMKHPTPYDGKQDIETFDNWVHSVTNYAKILKIREKTMILMMSEYVTGTARTFYSIHVAGKEDNWTYATIFPAIFDYCFPKDFMKRLRVRWNNLTQGKRRVREYVREIEMISKKFPEMSERTLVLKFWDGLNPELREFMALMNTEPELDEISDIVEKAELAEKARDERNREKGRRPEGDKQPPKREWTRFKNRTGGNRHFKPGNRDEKPNPNKSDKVRSNAMSPQNTPSQPSASGSRNQGGPKGKFNKQPRKLSREQLDALRAAGKCFNCRETGHEQRNCPKLNSMRPPRPAIGSGSISFAKMEELADRKEKADIYLGHVSLNGSDPIADESRELEELEIRIHRMCEAAWEQDPLWYNEETRPDCKYSIGVGEDEITIWDFQNGGSRSFARKKLDDPDFNLAGIFTDPEPNRPPKSVREGGYPSIENYQPWEWPAINWLHARLNGQLEYIDEGNGPDDITPGNRIDVQPTMHGYSLQLDESNLIYNLTHDEIRDQGFSPEWVIDHILAARKVPAEDRGDRFEDKRFTKYITLMLGMAKVPGQQTKIKKRGNKKRIIETEGVPAVERTTLRVKDKARKLPEPIVIQIRINGQSIRALLDTGSMADFISTTVADQLHLPRETYQKPLSVQLAVQGSRSKINCGTTVTMQYQSINCDRRFDIVNLDNYDAILGTPFLYQHQVAIGFNPSRVIIGSSEPLEMKGPEVTTISSAAADLLDMGLDKLRKQLRKEAEDLCPDTSRTALPPMRAVNHTIPIIDEKKIYHFRPSKCPDAFKDLWRNKKNAYLETGRWRTATGHNAIPLLMIPKPIAANGKAGLRTVFDKREQNANTHKLASPLPDIEEILREVSRHKYRSLIDGKDAYEQIRVVPEHVSRTIFTTPDGTMMSLVMQQGDCNAGATYQTLMNHIFAPYLGVFVYVYLDDIIIFSDSIEEHVKHVRIVFDILREQKLYLGPSKMQFFAEELKILGHVIDDKGISMDPHKVDKVLNWKAPSNKGLLRSFIGAVGFLAPDCKGIRIPMGQLSGMTSESRPWRWDDTAQRSFDEVKKIVNDHRDQRREAIDYSTDAPPIWVTTDGCLTGGGGYVSQGIDPDNAKVVGFWSGKWSAAQQNYPVHEQELLALVESLKRFRGILHGTKFTVRTDHKALIHLKKQRDLSPRQHRWLDVLNEFDFEIEYIPGETNELADALSRIYSDDQDGVVRAETEYVDDVDEPIRGRRPKTHPIYVDTALISIMNAEIRRSSRLARKPEVNYKESRDRKARVEGETENSPNYAQESPAEIELPNDVQIDNSLDNPRFQPRDAEDAAKLYRTIGDQDDPFPDCLKGRYGEDPMFKPILDNPSNFSNFEIREGLVFFRSEGMTRLAIPNVMVNDRSIREVVIRQAHSILAHLGGEKTMTYLREQVWWKSMVQDVKDYCKSCSICATSKSPTEKPLGLLKTMPVPTHPWQYIGIDFVGPLPESSNRNGAYDMICVIIDLLTAMVHLVPTRQTYKATDMAEVIFDTVYKLHGLPERIISDRDSLFTSHFWKKLHALLNIELRLSSAFHPQTDGSTERANRTMTQMLRQCVGARQKDWVTKLPAIEFAMNSARSSTTGFTPFYLNYGRNPSPMIWKGEEVYPGVRQFAENMKDAIMCAHDAIIASRVQHTVQANRKRSLATFQEGDLVYLSTKNISLPKGRARKLSPKYLGPFPITKVLKEGATYQLGLSDELIKRGVNRSFHASLLRPHVPNDDRRFPGRLPIQIPGFGERPEEWIVDRIMAHHGKGMGSEFLILWKAGDRTWASYREVAHLNALSRYCELMGVNDASELPSNRVSKESDIELNGIRVQVCLTRPEDKRDDQDSLSPILHSRSTRQTYHTMSIIRTTLSIDEVKECLDYEHSLNAHRFGVDSPPMIPPPDRWNDFLREQGAISVRRQNNRNNRAHHQSHSAHAPLISNNVSMPANTLETIIHAIGSANRGPAPIPRAPANNRPVPRRPTPPPNNNRGRINGRDNVRGGRGGNMGGRGRGNQFANRRSRTGRTGDPRRNQQDEGPPEPIRIPAPLPVVTEVPDAIPGPPSDLDGLDFLEEFANSDLPTITEDVAISEGEIVIIEDVTMANEAAIEGSFVMAGEVTAEGGFIV